MLDVLMAMAILALIPFVLVTVGIVVAAVIFVFEAVK